VTTTSAGPTALSLRLSADTEPQSVVTEQQIREQLRAALTKRFHEVLHQLKSPQLKPSQQSEQSREIFPFETLKNENKTLSKGEEEILQWAITCEVNNFDFYYPLLLAKTAAYEYFKEVTKGLTPKGPDSPYSPFNPRHPLYNLFYNFTKPKSNSTQDTAAPSC
jgi:hypothetical protein